MVPRQILGLHLELIRYAACRFIRLIKLMMTAAVKLIWTATFSVTSLTHSCAVVHGKLWQKLTLETYREKMLSNKVNV